MRDETKPENGDDYLQPYLDRQRSGWDQDDHDPTLTCGRVLLLMLLQGFVWFFVGLGLGLWL
jgi:hypothetical protein